MKKTKRGHIDHETFIFEDLKEILKSIFEIKRYEKRTIRRHDITYDLFVSIKSVKKGLSGYKFFDFLFQKKVLIAELKTPGQYFDLSVLVQVEDIEASYLNYLKREKQLKEQELDKTIILTVVTSISDGFIKRCRERKVSINRVKGKPGLYVIHRLIDIYILVIDKLEYNEAYVSLLKYVTDLKRLMSLVRKMKEGLRKEKYQKILDQIIEYKPEILTGRGKEMIPVFSDPKDRDDYIDRFFKGFGKENVVKKLKPKERLEGLKPKERLEGLKPKERLEGLKPKEMLEGLNKKDLAELKKLLLKS